MPLEKHDAKTISADTKVNTGDFAFNQHLDTGCLELGPGDLVEPGMRYIEAGIHAHHQGMFLVHDLVGIHPPAFTR